MPFGPEMRAAFVAPEGYAVFDGDYSQVEIRTFALQCWLRFKADRLLRIFDDDAVDPHKWVTELCGIPRRSAKILTFGGFYDQQEASAYIQVFKDYIDKGETPPTREEFHEHFMRHRAMFYEMPQYHRAIRDAIECYGYVETWFGRRLWVSNSRGHEYRSALAQPISGTAADILKLATPPSLEVVHDYGGVCVGTVHDELFGYVPLENAHEQFIADLKGAMEHAVALPVKIKAEVKIGKNWRDTH